VTTPLRICIGYDSREPLALQVLAHSILARASGPVSIIPIAKNHLRGVYTREDPGGTTEFSLTRFLSPYLCGYSGVGLFMDCDMLCLTDIYKVLDEVNEDYDGTLTKAAWVCPHDYQPKAGLKATGVQTAYPMKNWSSFMVFEARKCRELTPEYVNTASPADLHRFRWLEGIDAVGALPLEWNWLVGEYEPNPNAKILHYTLGTPCFADYRRSDHADLWFAELAAMNRPLTHWIRDEGPGSIAKAAGYGEAAHVR
jgi:hypothetical protein